MILFESQNVAWLSVKEFFALKTLFAMCPKAQGGLMSVEANVQYMSGQITMQ
jgi:hypothetical protein